MRSTDAAFLAEACGGRISGEEGIIVKNVKIDSRACGPGDLFVCIVGEKNDGHNYISKAYGQGCRAFLVSEDVEEAPGAVYIHVEDTNLAVRQMAQAYLAQFSVIKIGVTGSVGKTTTRMLTAAVMSAKYRTVCTQKNLNTHLGLCLTCFLADESTQCVVFEMGMDRKNEIAEYVEWVRPQLAIITNVGISHMERLGSRDAIADAKLEIVNKFTEDNTLIVNSFSDYLKTEAEIRERAVNKSGYKIVRVGEDICFENLKNKGNDGIEFYVNGVKFGLPLLGEHNALDACLAIACGKEFGITEEQASAALATVQPAERRLKAENINGVLLMDDSYNASPDSMKAGIAALEGVGATRRIAVLSDMLELGSAEDSGHVEVGKFAAEHGVDILIATGKKKEYYFRGVLQSGISRTSTIGPEDLDSVKDLVIQIVRPGDAVLVKGSNSTQIGQVAEHIRNTYGKVLQDK